MITLYNNDCLNSLQTLIDENIKVDCIITDPPYYVIPKGKRNDKFTWDNFQSLDHFINFTREWFDKCYNLLEDNSFMFIFWSQKHFKLGFELFNPSRVIFWHYENLVIGGCGDFTYNYEPIFVIKKGSPKLIKGKHSCILKYTKPQSNFKKDKLVHPTQKPLELMKYLVHVSNSQNILDPFMGSGTTGVACKELNKNFTGIELDKKYFDIAKERLNESN